MLKYLSLALDWVWNLKALEGVRHKVFRWAGLGLAAYQVLAVEPSSPLVFLPDVPTLWFAGFLTWLSTKGIEFAKSHKPG